MTYAFSVGNVVIKSGSTTISTISTATEVGVDWSLSTYKEYDADGILIDEIAEEETTTISLTYAGQTIDTTLIEGDYYNLLFSTGTNGTGISATLNNLS